MSGYSREILLGTVVVIAGDGLENSAFRSPGNMHRHPFLEIHFLREGRSLLRTEDGERELKRGEVVLIPPELLHALLPLTPEARRTALFLAPAERQQRSGNFSELLGVETLQILRDSFSGGEQAEELRRELVTGGRYGELRVRALCERLLVDLCRALSGEERESAAGRSERGEIEDYIRSEYASGRGIEGLAERLGVSARSVSRRVRAVYGRSFRQLMLEQRMSMARLYLSCGMTLAETAERLGYAEKSAFCHAFKQFYGVAPGEIDKSGQNARHPDRRQD